MSFIAGFLYFLPFFVTALVAYALWRNQRAAKDSELVDDSNFGPRVGAIIEVVLHPDHAANWWRPATKEESKAIEAETYRYPWGTAAFENSLYMVRVFPTLGMDSSEIGGISMDDGRTT